MEAIEGTWTPVRTVILQFPDMERARAWHDSPEYAPARAMRCACADTLMLLAEGLPVPFAPGS